MDDDLWSKACRAFRHGRQDGGSWLGLSHCLRLKAARTSAAPQTAHSRFGGASDQPAPGVCGAAASAHCEAGVSDAAASAHCDEDTAGAMLVIALAMLQLSCSGIIASMLTQPARTMA